MCSSDKTVGTDQPFHRYSPKVCFSFLFLFDHRKNKKKRNFLFGNMDKFNQLRPLHLMLDNSTEMLL